MPCVYILPSPLHLSLREQRWRLCVPGFPILPRRLPYAKCSTNALVHKVFEMDKRLGITGKKWTGADSGVWAGPTVKLPICRPQEVDSTLCGGSTVSSLRLIIPKHFSCFLLNAS